MLCKQSGQLNESGAFDQRLISRFHSRTNHRIEHPRGHSAGRPVDKPHVDHVPLAACRTEGIAIPAPNSTTTTFARLMTTPWNQAFSWRR
ncbi:hypothetical protein JZU57_02680, partial [bacterium]|nr:hypothetical protein [bacterium]